MLRHHECLDRESSLLVEQVRGRALELRRSLHARPSRSVVQCSTRWSARERLHGGVYSPFLSQGGQQFLCLTDQLFQELRVFLFVEPQFGDHYALKHTCHRRDALREGTRLSVFVQN